MSLLKKLKTNTKSKISSALSDSALFRDHDIIQTDVPMINVALSGDLNGGFGNGLTVLAGPSKHFKTNFALLMAKSFLDRYPDGVILFYDSEFGSPQGYFDTFGINLDQVFHTPVANVEELKFDIISQLEGLERDDHIMILVDSIGNLASKKELDDAIDGKSVADMSRAKALKSLFRMITPYLTLKDIPMVAINHTYQEIGLFPKSIVSGGTGIYYSADNIWIIGRRQRKEGKDIHGYDFVINVDKSRFVKEKSLIPITVTWDGGVERYSGLMELAMLGGFCTKPKNGWYAAVNPETGEVGPNKRLKDTMTSEFWEPILASPDFQKFVNDTYRIGTSSMLDWDDSFFEEIGVDKEEIDKS